MSYGFTMPKRTIMGENALIEGMKEIKKLGKKALVVCGKVMTKNGTVTINVKDLTGYKDKITVTEKNEDGEGDNQLEKAVEVLKEKMQ